MIRRTLMGALTLVLIGVIVYLTIQSRRREAQASKSAVEVVKDSVPTAIRVMTPDELNIADSELKVIGSTAHHRIVVQNGGKAAYCNIQLSFTYLGNSGKPLAARTYLVEKSILPGQSLSLDDIAQENIPKGAKNCTVKINHADLTQ
jgi:hypothetical protein